MKKIAIAISGGVDSGVAAALLVKGGYQCTGFHLHLWSESIKDKKFENKCCNTESLEAARKTAHQLGMTFHVLDYAKIFKKQVVDYFLEAYGEGLTPNPCVFCNRFIKFGELLNYVRKLGFDYLATGHYARIARRDTKYEIRNTKRIQASHVSRITYHLSRARDEQKDQSYFLYNLTQNQLAHILFPVGDCQKKEVMAMAKKWHLPVAHRPESQEICFLPENDYRPFLKRHLTQKIIPGEVVNIQGKTIGRHQGLPLYTIGQRHGFEIRTKNIKQRTREIIPPFYVIRKNIKKNQLIVGFGRETERKEFFVKDVNWLVLQSLGEGGIKCFVRIRHQGNLLGCRVQGVGGRMKVILHEPERGIAPGQAAVFYLGEEVLGGGIITN